MTMIMANVVLITLIYLLICICAILLFLRFKNKESQKRSRVYQTLVESSPVPLIIHKDGFILYMNEASVLLFDEDESDVIGKPLFNFVDKQFHDHLRDTFNDSSERFHVFSTNVRSEKGEMLHIEVTSVPIEYEGHEAHQVMIRDLTKQREAEEDLRYRAYHDGLTGLFNRECYEEVIRDILSERQNTEMFSVMLLDLDHFKKVNDTFGHKTGDRLLQHVSNVLTEGLDEKHSVFRLSGDEFAIISHNVESKTDVKRTAHHLLHLLSNPVVIDDYKLHITTSIGIIMIEDETEEEDILKFADTALYKAKELGRNKFVIFDQEMYNVIARKLRLENDLRQAIELKDFEMVYQPQFHIVENELTGMEALIRWNRNGEGYVSPAEFIPIAEDTGLIIPIGRVVIEKVFEDIQRWQSTYARSIRVALNVSLKQFQDVDFIPFFDEMLDKYQINPSWLEVEVTESIFNDDLELTQCVLHYLQSLGILVSIDDFGTGYSSLSYLKNLPINRLKIDKSFIQNLEDDSSGLAIVRTIIGLAKNLDKTVIAEGVETIEQLTILKENDCVEVQGFLFSKPLSVNETDKFLERHCNPMIHSVG